MKLPVTFIVAISVIAAAIKIDVVAAQSVAPYPPLMSDMAAHMKTYADQNQAAMAASPRAAQVNTKPKRPARVKPRQNRYARADQQTGFQITSGLASSIGVGILAAIGLAISLIISDDDTATSDGTSSTSTTTSTN